tara:strand:- start:1546 stop:2259 length:714 start_codon:yes stop_codon:yes gene_type:complete
MFEKLATTNELRFVLDMVDPSDALATALCCQDFKSAIFARVWPRVEGKRKMTTIADVVATVQKLEHARTLGCPLDARVCTAAAAAGALDVLQYARAQGCVIDTAAIRAAARGGHLHVVKELRSMGCPWHPDTTAKAAAGGHIELLKWIVANDAPWSESTCFEAAGSSSVELLSWAKEHGAPFQSVEHLRADCDHYVSVYGGGSIRERSAQRPRRNVGVAACTAGAVAEERRRDGTNL